ncbi:hypothetical protein H9P43_006956 [Blastocladiella emersonii ATCC 22665]|nr:hypothetical protein H9P43_006956 [Blastocladiella emersonii ATCC 22665]
MPILRIEDLAKQNKVPAAVIILNRLSVIPPSNTSHAHTPVLEVQYMPAPAPNRFTSYDRRASKATLALFDQIANKYRLHGPNPAPPTRITLTTNFASLALQYLELGHFSMPAEGVWNESYFEPAFFKRIQPHLYRSFLVPHYPRHGAEYRVPIPEVPVEPHACTPARKALERGFAADHHEEWDERIVEIE